MNNRDDVPLYKALDRLMVAFKRAELLLGTISVSKEGLDLSIKKKRIMYKGKPVNDCSAHERIEAGKLFGELLVAIDEQDTTMTDQANAVAVSIEHWLQATEGGKR